MVFGFFGVSSAVAAPGDFLVTEYTGDSVVDVSGGGDVSADARFATGLSGPVSLCVGPNDDIYVSNFVDGTVDIITDGGDFAAVPAFAEGLGNPGQLLCSTGIVLVADTAGRVIDVTAGGDFSLDQGWAWDNNGTTWSGLIRDGGGNVYVSAFSEGEVYDITGGGDFTDASPFAFGIPNATVLSDSSAGLLVVHGLLGDIKDFSPGDDISDDAIWAEVPNAVSVYDRGSDGIWALGEDPTSNTGAVWDITGGGNFDLIGPDAWGIDSLGLAAGGMLFHVCQVDNDCDDNDVCNGDETLRPQRVPPPGPRWTATTTTSARRTAATRSPAARTTRSPAAERPPRARGPPPGPARGPATGAESSGGSGTTSTTGIDLTTGSTGGPDPDTTTGTPDPTTSGGPGSSTATASTTTPNTSGGTDSDTDGEGEDTSDEGCGCRSTPTPPAALLLLLPLALRRRRGR